MDAEVDCKKDEKKCERGCKRDAEDAQAKANEAVAKCMLKKCQENGAGSVNSNTTPDLALLGLMDSYFWP